MPARGVPFFWSPETSAVDSKSLAINLPSAAARRLLNLRPNENESHDEGGRNE
jgi:hypothetical protein